MSYWKILLGLVIGLVLLPVQAFQTSNIQVLTTNQFDGDAFIYDTVDGQKTTVTLEHFRTWQYGDMFMFVDLMAGEKFDGNRSDVYLEIAPRLSLSTLSKRSFENQIVKDWFIASQVNLGDGYEAWLAGVGLDLKVPGLNVASLNLYKKRDNFNNDLTQLTAVYQTQALASWHLEGFVDITQQDVNTHNQLLYQVTNGNQSLYVGLEWIRYRFENRGATADSSGWQLMAKMKF